MEGKILLSTNDTSYYKKLIPKNNSEHIQTYYDHGLRDDPIGYNAAYSFARYSSDVGVDLDQMELLFVYMGNPSFKNAVNLLKSQNIHVPLESLLDYLQENIIPTTQNSIRARGGMDSEFIPVKKRKRSTPIPTSTIKLKTLIGLDTLKDIHPTQCDTLWNMVNLSKKEKDSICSSDPHVFRNQSAKALSKYLDVSMKSEEIAIASANKVIQIEKDTLLYKQILKWIHSSDLTIVIDGLMNDKNRSAFTREVMIHALLQAMLTNMSKLQKYVSGYSGDQFYLIVDPLPHTIKTITFLNGEFEINDGLYLAPFKQKYFNSLVKEIKTVKNVFMKQVDDYATYFEKYYGTDSSGNHWQGLGDVLRKKELQKQFMDKKSSDEYEDIAVRNFVRDAWKADISIKYNAIFLTCDKNALMYHKWISKNEELDRNAIGLFLGDKAFVSI